MSISPYECFDCGAALRLGSLCEACRKKRERDRADYHEDRQQEDERLDEQQE